MDLQDVVVVNGTTLYYERTGTGPSVLFIIGTTGDAGHFAQVAARLADEFTVVTYDRRGNSRSPRPAGWTQTSVPEQAEDAAALIQALQLAPLAVFAASSVAHRAGSADPLPPPAAGRHPARALPRRRARPS
jgi:pimeloyl-ACP methyl ester carboxylesterase